ncbi:hypothetical protein HS125_00140 [bacterium]|nr:hypothetical protein [bacterium]
MEPTGPIDLSMFYKTPAQNAVLWAVVTIGVLVVGGIALHRFFLWWHARREEKVFFSRLAARGVDAAGEDALVDLVNHNLDILGRPTEIFRSLRVFDRAASEEIIRLLSSQLPPVAKQEQLDRLYLLRRQMFPAESGTVPEGRGEDA